MEDVRTGSNVTRQLERGQTVVDANVVDRSCGSKSRERVPRTTACGAGVKIEAYSGGLTAVVDEDIVIEDGFMC